MKYIDGDFRLNNFDLIRIIAATQVLVVHTIHRLELPRHWVVDLLASFPGVPIFFVVSGFLVAASLDRSSSLLRYARNRVARIFPGLWVCLIVTAVVAFWFGFSLLSPQGLVWLAAQFFGVIYTPDFLRQFGIGSYNGSLWTIPIELQFYIVLPIACAVAARVRLNAKAFWICLTIALSILAIAIGYLFPDLGQDDERSLTKFVRYSFVPHVYLFILGVTLQKLAAWQWNIIRGKFVWWIAVYGVLVSTSIATGLISAPPIAVVLMMSLGMTAISAAYSLPTLASRTTRGVDLSYGVYIYHGLLINILFQIKLKNGPYLLAIVLAGAFFAATLSWFLVEKPALAIRRQAKDRSSASVAVPS